MAQISAHPYLSPLFGDLKDFPPTILTTGTRDLYLSNTVRMHRALRAAGVAAELHVTEAGPHTGFPGGPEGAAIDSEIRGFIEKVICDMKELVLSRYRNGACRPIVAGCKGTRSEQQHSQIARMIPMEGGRNFRDVGGYRTADGRTVRWNALYRSGSLGNLQKAGMARLSNYGYSGDNRPSDDDGTQPRSEQLVVHCRDGLLDTRLSTGR